MLYNTISAKAIIGRAIDSFGIENSNFTYKALEWIGDGIAEIGYNVGLVNKYARVQVFNNTIEKPADFFELLYMSHNGARLTYGIKPPRERKAARVNPDYDELITLLNARNNSIDNADGEYSLDSDCIPCEVSQHTLLNADELDRVDNRILHMLDGLKTTLPIDEEEYFLNSEGNCYKTSIDEGDIIIYYKAYPVDSEGYPLVVDEPKYKMALEYVVMERLMRSGTRHPVLTYQEVKADKSLWIGKARNQHKMFNEAQARAFLANWTSMTFQIQPSNNYYSNG